MPLIDTVALHVGSDVVKSNRRVLHARISAQYRDRGQVLVPVVYLHRQNEVSSCARVTSDIRLQIAQHINDIVGVGDDGRHWNRRVLKGQERGASVAPTRPPCLSVGAMSLSQPGEKRVVVQ